MDWRSTFHLTHGSRTHFSFFIRILYLLAKIRMMLNLCQGQALRTKTDGCFVNYASSVFVASCASMMHS